MMKTYPLTTPDSGPLAEADCRSGPTQRADDGIGLGIDAGGTYTDAVVYDLGRRELLAKAKALTTYSDFVKGIREALAQLPDALLRRVRVTALSTTLATNSIVEGRGHRVGIIALSPWGWTEEQVGHTPLINVPGAVSITGEVLHPLDEISCRAAVETLVDAEGCEAIVVAGYATVRNPEQANRVREIILEMRDVPVVCSHEVSRRLNGIFGAQTAVANAALLPAIRALIDSVRRALADFGVAGGLMVVKGDGTPVDESVARERPVETILSGPAASVSGARILTGCRDALVIDVGGTTTDCAIVEDGHVAVSKDGARVGSWVMGVDAVEVSTAGLGGDSRLDFTRDRRISVGPMRSIPLCAAADEFSYIKDWLVNFDIERHSGDLDTSALDVLVLGEEPRVRCGPREEQLLHVLRDGPVPAVGAADEMGLPSHILLPLSRLEACGAVKRSALTPTDLLHVQGRFTRWDTEAAELALKAFAAVYGDTPENTLDAAMIAFTRGLFEQIVRREVSAESPKLCELPADWSFLMDKAFADSGAGLGVKLSLRRPIVAVGAPAGAFVPDVARHLAADVVIPEHADVANAIGAIGSEVTVREEVLIKPGQRSGYVLHGSQERAEYVELERATQEAVELSRQRALGRAVEAGAAAPQVRVVTKDLCGSASEGGSVFLERRIIAIATGGAFGNRRTYTCP